MLEIYTDRLTGIETFFPREEERKNKLKVSAVTSLLVLDIS